MINQTSSAMNYYEELGIGPEATEQEIRKAHRRLVKLMHPDAQPDQNMKMLAETQMRRLNSIVSTLLDHDQRRSYDDQLHAARMSYRHGPQIRSSWRGIPWWLGSAIGAVVLTLVAVWVWANHLGNSFGNKSPRTAYLPPAGNAPAVLLAPPSSQTNPGDAERNNPVGASYKSPASSLPQRPESDRPRTADQRSVSDGHTGGISATVLTDHPATPVKTAVTTPPPAKVSDLPYKKVAEPVPVVVAENHPPAAKVFVKTPVALTPVPKPIVPDTRKMIAKLASNPVPPPKTLPKMASHPVLPPKTLPKMASNVPVPKVSVPAAKEAHKVAIASTPNPKVVASSRTQKVSLPGPTPAKAFTLPAGTLIARVTPQQSNSGSLLPAPPRVATALNHDYNSSAVPSSSALPTAVPPSIAPVTTAASSAVSAINPRDPLEGEWVYAPKEPERRRSGFYPPEFIDLKLFGSGDPGNLKGQYSAKYAVTDRPVASEVSFELASVSKGSRRFLWHNNTGAKGTLNIDAIDERTIQVDWRTTSGVRGPALTSGTATLVRR